MTKTETDDLWIVVWWDDRGAMFTLVDRDDNIISRPFLEVADAIDEPLDDPEYRQPGRRYAIPASVARDTFGWPV